MERERVREWENEIQSNDTIFHSQYSMTWLMLHSKQGVSFFFELASVTTSALQTIETYSVVHKWNELKNCRCNHLISLAHFLFVFYNVCILGSKIYWLFEIANWNKNLKIFINLCNKLCNFKWFCLTEKVFSYVFRIQLIIVYVFFHSLILMLWLLQTKLHANDHLNQFY